MSATKDVRVEFTEAITDTIMHTQVQVPLDRGLCPGKFAAGVKHQPV